MWKVCRCKIFHYLKLCIKWAVFQYAFILYVGLAIGVSSFKWIQQKEDYF